MAPSHRPPGRPPAPVVRPDAILDVGRAPRPDAGLQRLQLRRRRGRGRDHDGEPALPLPGQGRARARARSTRYTTRFEAALADDPTRARPRAAAWLDGLREALRATCSRRAGCACAGCSPPSTRRCPTPRAGGDPRLLRRERGLAHGRARRGARTGRAHLPGDARDAARQWTSALEGAMLLARPYGDASRLSSVARRMLDDLTRAPSRGAPRAKRPEPPRADARPPRGARARARRGAARRVGREARCGSVTA